MAASLDKGETGDAPRLELDQTRCDILLTDSLSSVLLYPRILTVTDRSSGGIV